MGLQSEVGTAGSKTLPETPAMDHNGKSLPHLFSAVRPAVYLRWGFAFMSGLVLQSSRCLSFRVKQRAKEGGVVGGRPEEVQVLCICGGASQSRW